YNGIFGAASTFTKMNVFNVKLKSGGDCDLSFPANYNTALLVIEGRVSINGTNVPTDNFVLLANDGEDFSIVANDDSVVLVLSGEPINEPIASRGPFVMNTTEEIIKAYYDYNQGKFGHLD
ncbi:MAG: pirin-like C-terminal cupin domain-containing protein, partial [Burkholderiales bacterium]|nr:pirin-like C-terminal cupin domain-containing protein [Burkholderiales bacterium]